jgi:ABC-2 type transport system permease protein
MAANSELIIKGNTGWLGGFSNMFAKENRRWWRTRQWLVQTLVWLGFINGILALTLWSKPNLDPSWDEATRQAYMQQIPLLGLEIFIIMLGMVGAVGATLLGQDAMLNEKNRGTAAWVMSKPASRAAFVLSKVISNSLGILVTMVIIQGAAGYLQFWLKSENALPLPEFAGAMGMGFASLFFYLTLTIMLGSITNSRGVVIGIPILINLGYQLFFVVGEWIGEIMPWNLVSSLGTKPAMAMLLIQGQPLQTMIPLVATVLWSILFIVVALWRFSREEF